MADFCPNPNADRPAGEVNLPEISPSALFNSYKLAKYTKTLDLIIGQIFMNNVKELGWTVASLEDPVRLNKIYIGIKGYINNMLVKKYASSTPPSSIWKKLSDDAAGDLHTIVQNFDVFAKEHLRFSNVVNTKDFKLEDVPDDTIVTDENVEVVESSDPKEEEANGSKDTHDKIGNEAAQIDLAAKPVKVMFMFLPHAEYNPDIKKSEAVLDKDGLPRPADPARVWNLLAERLAGEKDFAKFKAIMLSDLTRRIIPEVQFLIDILGLEKPDYLKTSEEHLQTIQFFQTFSKPKIQLQSSYLSKDGIFSLSDEIMGNRQKIEILFNNRFVIGNIDEGYQKYVKRSRTGVRLLWKKNTEDEYLPPKPNDYDSSLEFLQLLGFNFSFINLLDPTETANFRDAVTRGADRLYISLNRRLTISDAEGVGINQVNAPIKELKSKLGKIPSEISTIKELIQFESVYSQVAPTHSARTATGEMAHLINQDSALSVITYHLNSAATLEDLYKTASFANAKYNRQFRNSHIINYLFDENGERHRDKEGNIKNRKVILNIQSGFNLEGQDGKVNTQLERDLSPRSKFIQDFNNFFTAGRTDILRTADSNSFFSIELSENGFPYNYINAKGFNKSFTRDKRFVGQVLKYLNGEIARIKSFPKKKLENPTLPDAYGEFSIFSEISPELRDLLKDTTPLEMDSPLFKNFLEEFDELMQKEVKDLVKFINKSDLSLEELLSEKVEDIGVSPENLFRAFVAGTWLQDVEYSILYSGDPLFFGKNSHKRFKGLSSTGNLSVDPALSKAFFDTLQERNYHDQYSLAAAMDVTRRDNSKKFKTQTMTEPLSNDNGYSTRGLVNHELISSIITSQNLRDGKSQTAEEIAATIVGREKIMIADGQSWITLDFYREQAVRWGFITPEMEVVFKYEGLVFRKYMVPGYELSTDQQQELERLEYMIYMDADKYALPVLKGGYWGSILNATVDAKAYDKTSVAPLVPSYIKNKPELLTLNRDMIKGQYAYIKYPSSTKGFATTPVTSLQGATADEYSTMLFKEQIKTVAQQKTEASMLTQEIKLLFANLFDQGKAKTPRIQTLYDRYRATLNAIQAEQRIRVLRDLGFKRDQESGEFALEQFDPIKLSKKLVKEAKRQELNSNIITSLSINPQTGQFNSSPEASGFQKQVNALISGILDRTLRTFKFPGGDFVLISNVGQPKLRWYKLTEDGSESVECRITLTRPFSRLLNRVHTDDEMIGTLDRLNGLLQSKKWREDNKKALTVIFGRAPIDGPHSMGHGQVVEFLPPTMGNALILPDEYVLQAGIDFDYDKERVITPYFDSYGNYLTNKPEERLHQVVARLNELQDVYPELRNLVNVDTDEVESYRDYRNMVFAASGGSGAFIDHILKAAPKNTLGGLEDTDYEVDALLEEYKNLKSGVDTIASNELLEVVKDILATPEMFADLVSPLTTKNARTIAENIGNITNRSIELPQLGRVFHYMENLNVFSILFGAKRLLAAFAKENTSQQLLTYSGIDINDVYYTYEWDKVAWKKDPDNPRIWKPNNLNNLLMTDKEYEGVHKDRKILTSLRDDIIGFIKQHWNSELISGMVDVGKDPFAYLLNITLSNVGVVNILKNFGVPFERIIYFINHPSLQYYFNLRESGMKQAEAMEKLARERLNLKTVTTTDRELEDDDAELYTTLENDELVRRRLIGPNDTFELIQKDDKTVLRKTSIGYPDVFAVKDVFTMIDNKKAVTKKAFSGAKAFMDLNKYLRYDQITAERLEYYAHPVNDRKKIAQDKVDDRTKAFSDELRIVAHFFALEKASWALKDFRTYFNHDTTKVSTLTDIRAKEKLREKILNQKIVSPKDFLRMEKESIIASFMNNDIIGAIYRQVFPVLADENVQNTMATLYEDYNSDYKSKNKRDLRNLPDILNDDFLSSIIFNFGKYEGKNIFDRVVPQLIRIKDEDRTFGDVLDEFKHKPYYAELSRQYPVLDRFITDKTYIHDASDPNGLAEPFTLDSIKFIKNQHETNIEQESIIEQLRELYYNYQDENSDEIKNFLKELFLVGIVQSGFSKSFISYAEFVPYTFTKKMYTEAMNVFHTLLDEDQKIAYMKNFARKFKANNPRYFPYQRKDVPNKNKYSHLFKLYRFGFTVETAKPQPKYRVPMYFTDGDSGRTRRPEFAGKSDMDLVLSGDKRAHSIDLKKSKMKDMQIGDPIELYDKNDRVMLARITKVPYPISSITPEEWSKLETWTADRYQRLLAANYSQFQFEPWNKPIPIPEAKAPVQPLIPITEVTRSSKKETYTMTLKDGTKEEREGYRIHIKEYPNANMFIYKDGKTWHVDEMNTSKEFTTYTNTLKEILEEIKEGINQHLGDPAKKDLFDSIGIRIEPPNKPPINPCE